MLRTVKPANSYQSPAIGDKIRRLRYPLGLTQQALASLVFVDQSFISQAERGLVPITLEELERIARALEVSVGTLVQA